MEKTDAGSQGPLWAVVLKKKIKTKRKTMTMEISVFCGGNRAVG